MTIRSMLATLTVTVVAALGVAAPAGAQSLVGSGAHDLPGQDVRNGSVVCTVTAGDPVVVNLANGSRVLRATATVRCNAPIHLRAIHTALDKAGEGIRATKNTGALADRTSASQIIQIPCTGSGASSWSSVVSVGLDMDRNGTSEVAVWDVSRWNLRSCA